MSFHGKTQRAKEIETFANALRACLGLQPLYGEKISEYRLEYELPAGARRADEWFRVAPSATDDRGNRSIALALRRNPGMQSQRRTP